LPRRLLAEWEEAQWPGNVRELRNAVARAIALGDLSPPERMEIDQPNACSAPPSGHPRAEDFLARVLAENLPLPLARLRVVQEFERRYIAQVLAQHDGSVARAAKASGIARRYFEILRAGKRR
jgi:DNA-binding NtrC family response regulator